MSQPNIVLFVSDQHRADWMGCAGNPFVQTPNLDRLAEDGVRFTQAYCNAPICVPSRMSMMTGRFPHRIEVMSNNHILSSDIPTFAHALSIAGYETVLGGRMHFVGPDQRHGYQKRLVGDITNTYPGGPKTEYGRLKGTDSRGIRSIELAGGGDSPVLQFDGDVIEACERFLAERGKKEQGGQEGQEGQEGQDKPLFLTVGLYGPHTPYVSPPELFEQALKVMEGQDTPIPIDASPQHPWIEKWFKAVKIREITDEEIRRVRAAYAGSVGQLDEWVGRIVHACSSLPGETIFIYLSDHGEMAGDHGMFWKFNFYQPAVNVPIIVTQLGRSEAGLVEKGRTVSAPVSLVDLAPTLVSLGGCPAMPGLDGDDLTPMLRGPQEHAQKLGDRAIFSEIYQFGAPVRMMIRYPYKLIYYHGFGSPQLFNLQEDPEEQIDLSGEEGYSNIRKELLAELLDGWDPERITQRAEEKGTDTSYISKWGSVSSWGRHELWDPEDPFRKLN
ncbi:MAG: Arylsulfatase [Paenibacillaceae bacterium]|nr:Arylsulfatase [Paenibacillaceae bacterium]